MRDRTPPPPELLVQVTDAQAAQLPAWAKERALVRVNWEYENIASIGSLPLELLNRAGGDVITYPRQDDVIREYTARAGAVAGFAVSLRLITPEQALDAILQFQERHPEIWGEPEPPDVPVPGEG